MVLPGAVFILAKIGKNDLSGVVIGVASALLAIAIIGNIVIFFRQESLTSKPNCVRTVIDQARQLHKHATGFTPDRVVALTTVSEDSSFLDLHR